MNRAEIRELLNIYYKGFAIKKGWEAVIYEDFKFVGGDIAKTTPIVGKQAYIEIIKRFSKLFISMRVKEMIVEDQLSSFLFVYKLNSWYYCTADNLIETILTL